jgi:hypothetical protein
MFLGKARGLSLAGPSQRPRSTSALQKLGRKRTGKGKGKPADVESWRLHDIRRTVVTRMIDIGILPHVVEAVVNHISGHRAGVAGVYNRAALCRPARPARAPGGGAHDDKTIARQDTSNKP